MRKKRLKLYQMYRLHRRLWLWLAKTGNKFKDEWPGWEFDNIPFKVSVRINCHCFACEYASYFKKRGIPKCAYCPFIWPDNILCSNTVDDSLWNEWCHEEHNHLRKQLAQQIADLPLKPYPLRSLATHNRR